VLPLLAGFVTLGLLSTAVPAAAVESPPTADAPTTAFEQLRAANVARADLAREEAAWKSERERLQAAIAATRAEVARLERDAAEAEAQRDSARAKLAAIGSTSDLDLLRSRLGDAGVTLRSALKSLTLNTPPGTIAAPADDLSGEALFDAAVRALDAAERAAGTLGVEVVSGTRGGQSEAVKLLRVAGAAAWWVSLDGTAAGTAQIANGKLQLTAANDEPTRLAIINALAQAEGRAHPTVVVLPAPARAGGQP
jgi:chromosome segregation protein